MAFLPHLGIPAPQDVNPYRIPVLNHPMVGASRAHPGGPWNDDITTVREALSQHDAMS